MQISNDSPLTHPTQLPLQSITAIDGPVLVVAPHPDDETLGNGGAIALLRQQGVEVKILIVSDGTMSHPRSKRYPATVLSGLRQTETLEAMEILGVSSTSVSFWQFPDGKVPAAGLSGFEEAVCHCQNYLASQSPIKTIMVPWRYDPHADHRATWQIVQTAVSNSERLLEYPIWDWDTAQRRGIPTDLVLKPWRLDIQAVVALKQQAIGAYRSQISDLIDDDPTGFRLSAEMLQHFKVPWEVYIEVRD